MEYTSYPNDVALLAAGAPCQPFSLGGKHVGHADERNMFPEVFRAVRELRPQAFLLENVRGLARPSFRPYLDFIWKQLAFPHVCADSNDYWTEHLTRLEEYVGAGESVAHSPWFQAADDRYDVIRPHVVNVADFGVPQERHRVFIAGFRHDLGVRWCFPERTHSADALLYSQYVDGTYWEEHSLARPPVPDRFKKRVDRLATRPKPMERRWRTVRDAIGDLPEPVNHRPHTNYDNHIGIPGARIYPGHTGSPWDWPAKTIKAGDHGNPGGENMLRFEDGTVRYFTIRELARLQTFPDEWHFASSWSESRRQLGNAVPVVMAELLAKSISSSLERASSASRGLRSELSNAVAKGRSSVTTGGVLH